MAADIDAVTDALRVAALCVTCVARKAGSAPFSILSALAWIGQRVKITNEVALCDGCVQKTVVYRIR